MNWERLFNELLRADNEQAVLEILQEYCLLDNEHVWQPLGGIELENNFSIVANQQDNPSGALVEKIINSIDAVLMAKCFTDGIDPESTDAPDTMAAAVDQFFNVRDGRVSDLTSRERTKLAQAIHLVAEGSKKDPSYLIVDTGEGQTPASFPSTFLSLAKSNKLRIPFVQGKFNAGGTGVLQFCGRENFQLIASRRHPAAPVTAGDNTRDLWGFTLVRRQEPSPDDNRRSSMYVYLAPDGHVPSFRASAVLVLPGASRENTPPKPLVGPIEYGTIIKLYSYRWKARNTATIGARFEIEKHLHSPCLPFRIDETRDYRANTYSTTVAGVWAMVDAQDTAGKTRRVEPGFPATGKLNLDSVGPLQYKLAVFTKDVKPQTVPHGVFFTINGQVHGSLSPDFVARRLGFEYLRNHIIVSVDCTQMKKREREDLFLASRDRLRRNEVYEEIVSTLQRDLKQHPGLRELNAARRSARIEKALDDQEDVVQTLERILKTDPSLAQLLDPGDRLVTTLPPPKPSEFKGRRFPTYFRLAGDPKKLVKKTCPLNRTCKVDFETDAENDYFDRSESPGEMIVDPSDDIRESGSLWNGTYTARFKPPSDAKPGEQHEVSVYVNDPDRDAKGSWWFESNFTIEVLPPTERKTPPGPKPPKPPPKRLAIPNIYEIYRDGWDRGEPAFTPYDALRVIQDGEDGYDFWLNRDNTYLLREIKNAKESEKDIVVHWFKWGLALAALGMLQHPKRLAALQSRKRRGDKPTASSNGEDVVEAVNGSINGLASMIVPIIRNLYQGPE